ncbi:unnamed protein product [Orchesella dallaii]|uniref:Damage-specific DNA-binding protein 2 n=1 Tax=Orchesella dallaii TaxID=48710 RepID=A0ABP1QLQ3_9HEXA
MARAKKKEESAPAVRLPSSRNSKKKAEADSELASSSTVKAPVAKTAKAKTSKGISNVTVKEKPCMTEEELAEVLHSQIELEEKPRNILKCLDLLQYGPKRDRSFYVKTVKNNLVQGSIQNLRAVDYVGKFTRRITALAWHQRYPYILASASKFGDIMYICGTSNELASRRGDEPMLNFATKAEIQGAGAGASVTAMKFHESNPSLLYRSSIDCTVSSVNVEQGGRTQVFHNTGDYNRWFCSMDVNFPRNLVIAGDNKGLAYKFSMDGKLVDTVRLHKDKIHHCEFSTKDPNLLVTSSLGKPDGVKIWDIRYINTKSKGGQGGGPTPLHTLEHSVALNCARFSPVDGSRLLTSDQLDEIRIYQGPLWKDYVTIKHHHKQFQHITPVKADWHPINDYIVIGRYPKTDREQPKNRLPRAIEFFDSYTGKLVDAIYPPLDEICSLNLFNPTGEYLASGMNSKLVLWGPSFDKELSVDNSTLPKVAGKSTLSDSTRNVLRGRRAREYSPASGDDNEEEDTTAKKKKARIATASTTSTSSSKISSKSGASKKKK